LRSGNRRRLCGATTTGYYENEKKERERGERRRGVAGKKVEIEEGSVEETKSGDVRGVDKVWGSGESGGGADEDRDVGRGGCRGESSRNVEGWGDIWGRGA